jgi:flagellar biosynthetic protein FliS
MNRTGLAYRKNAAEAPSGLGLLIALFDTLAMDLGRAAEAQHKNEIEKRCGAVRHALLVIGHLEDWVSRGTGGALAQDLIAFYATLRRNLIEAEARNSADILDQQMTAVLKLRTHWQKFESESTQKGPEILRPERRIPPGYPESIVENRVSSWSA